jgi:putative serine protease PepD
MTDKDQGTAGNPGEGYDPGTPHGGVPAPDPQAEPNPWSAQAQESPADSRPGHGPGYDSSAVSGQGEESPADRPQSAQAAESSAGSYDDPYSGRQPVSQYPVNQQHAGAYSGGQHSTGHYPGQHSAGQHSNPYATQHDSYSQQTYTYPTPPPLARQQRGGSGRGKLVAGVAALALVVGGVAGGAGGYIAAENSGSTAGSLSEPLPAKQTGNAPAGSVSAVAQKVLPSVVQLQVRSGNTGGEGSGFVISEDGYILTNNHVVESAAGGRGQIRAVFQDGQEAAATVVGRDPTTDIAVVKVDGVDNLTPVDLGRSDDLRVGQPVVAIGSPFELSGTVTAGIISALNRPVSAGGGGQTTVMDAIQTDAAINPGNSGGPLVNMKGQIIGINSAIYSPQSSGGLPGQQSEGGNVGIGFAIPIDQARRTAQEIIETGHATQTYIGAQVGNAPSGGAEIVEVFADSPAQKAGLKPGDVVTKMDDRSIDNADELVAAVRTKAPGEKVTFTVGDSRTVEVTLGGEPIMPN